MYTICIDVNWVHVYIFAADVVFSNKVCKTCDVLVSYIAHVKTVMVNTFSTFVT